MKEKNNILKSVESSRYPKVGDFELTNDKSENKLKAGFLIRTDNLPVDETILELAAKIPLPALDIILPVLANNPELMNRAKEELTLQNQVQKVGKGYSLAKTNGTGNAEYHLLSRLMSVSDLTPNLYDVFKDNKTALSNWFPQVNKAVEKQNFFKVPETKVVRLPIELAQYIRTPYQETSKADRDKFNRYIFKKFDLKDEETYFIKTGTFSSKFQFANAKCTEPREMGDYFHVINNFAMEVGAGHTIELVVRNYIEDVDKRPSIYNGMPLRTEFRAFIDFDHQQLLGTVPYWHPSVMEKGLKNPYAQGTIEKDFATYLEIKSTLMSDFEESVTIVNKHLKKIMPNIELKGCYSLDVMKNGNDYYIIDMALAQTSALSELLPQYPVKD